MLNLHNMINTYLGDGVYLCYERGMLKLTTNNGVQTTNTIYLEPEVWAAMVKAVNLISRGLDSSFGTLPAG